MSGAKYRTRRPLPPYGRQFMEGGRYAWVAMGPGAWDFVRSRHHPVMVLPDEESPDRFAWPVAGLDVQAVELGAFDSVRCDDLALALLLAGAVRVYLVREALLPSRNRGGVTAWPIQTYVREHHERAA